MLSYNTLVCNELTFTIEPGVCQFHRTSVTASVEVIDDCIHHYLSEGLRSSSARILSCYFIKCLGNDSVLVEHQATCSCTIRERSTTKGFTHQIEQSISSRDHVVASVQLIVSIAVVRRSSGDSAEVSRRR